MPTKAELMEQNTMLLNNAIIGWASRIAYMIADCDIDQRTLDGLTQIINEMRNLSGE